jgi:endoribonuclease Dicer
MPDFLITRFGKTFYMCLYVRPLPVWNTTTNVLSFSVGSPHQSDFLLADAPQGDAFLKYLCTIYVFVAEPTQNEGSLHIARQKLISNKSLLENSNLIGLPVYIQGKPFPAKSWQPPNFRLTPRTSKLIIDKSDEEAVTPVILCSEMSSDAVEAAVTRTSTACNPSLDLAVVNKTSNVNERDPPFYGKTNKKKARQDEQSSQWLGDKVIHQLKLG